jgi:hypothetical protein
MESPELKYTYVDGRKASEFMLHDGIEARYVVHPDGQGGWYDRTGVMVASNATEAGQVSRSDLGEHPARDQGGEVAKTSSGNRVRKSRKKPEA